MRQRVQRLIETGVMQVVAVTDPLELGFARQAMVGVRVTGPLEPVADALAELDEVDYVVVTAGLLRPARRGRLRERRAPARADLRADPGHHGRRRDRDVHVPEPAQADLLLGGPLSGRTEGPALQRLSLWHDTVDTDWTPAARARRRPSTPTSRSSAPASPGCGRRTTSPRPTRTCGSSCSRRRPPASAPRAATAAGARRCSRPRSRRWRGTPTARPRSPSTGRCGQTVDEVVRAAAARGHRRRRWQGRHDHPRPQPRAVVARQGRGRGRPGLGPRRGRRTPARPRGGDRDPARQPHPRRDVHPGLRGDPSRATGARARRARSSAAA